MTIDLRLEARELRKLLEEKTRAHIDRTGRENLPPASALEIGFGLNQAGWIVINFDTRDKHDRDGEWTLLIEQQMSPRDHWYEAYEASQDSNVDFILMNGTSYMYPAVGEDGDEISDQRFASLFGEMIRDVTLQANKDGVFTDVPKQKNFQLDIEEFDNMWAWPTSYGDLGTTNLLE